MTKTHLEIGFWGMYSIKMFISGLVCRGDTCMGQGLGVRGRSREKGHQLIKVEKNHTSKSCNSCPKKEEAVRIHQSLSGDCGPADSTFETPLLLDCERMHFCCLSHPVFGHKF